MCTDGFDRLEGLGSSSAGLKDLVFSRDGWAFGAVGIMACHFNGLVNLILDSMKGKVEGKNESEHI